MLVANFFDIFTDHQGQLRMDRHNDRFLRQISKAVRLIEYPRRGTRGARRDFSPYFFYINRIVQVDTNCSSIHHQSFHALSLAIRHDLFTGGRFFSPRDKLPQAEWPPRVNKLTQSNDQWKETLFGRYKSEDTR